jgi:ELWxxDGT repeat protein
MGGRVLFVTGLAHKLRRTNGMSAGTVSVRYKSNGQRVLVPGGYFRDVPGIGVLFDGPDGELWKSNGWRNGTVRVKDIRSGPDGSYPFDFAALGQSNALFAANEDMHGQELWITDGTPNGTHLVEDINHPLP